MGSTIESLTSPDVSIPQPAPRLRRRELALAAAWVALPALLWAAAYSRHHYNNFRIYRHVFWHLLERCDLYAPYPAQHGDVNLYGPVFGIVIAPFAVLPEAVGGLLWSLAMAAVLWVAVQRLRLPPERRLLALLLVLPELLTSVHASQFNPAVAALPLLTLADLEEGRDLRAPLWSLLGAFVKLYSAVGLVLVLFSRRPGRFLLGCALWSGLLLVAPMALAGPEHVLASYQDWYAALVRKSAVNLRLCGDISLVGLVRRAAGVPLSYAGSMAAGMALALAPLLRRAQHSHPGFRRLALASLLFPLVLFSSGSEDPTYVVAATGAGLWLIDRPGPPGRHGWWLVAAMVLVALGPTHLLSVPVARFFNHYALKAVLYGVVWVLLLRDLLQRDFREAQQASGTGLDGEALLTPAR